MENYVQPGGVIDLVAPEDLTSGEAFMVGNIFAVATATAASGATVPAATEGVFDILKDTNLVISAGDRLFWDATNKWLDKTATAQIAVAVAVASALQAATTVRAKIIPTTPAGT